MKPVQDSILRALVLCVAVALLATTVGQVNRRGEFGVAGVDLLRPVRSPKGLAVLLVAHGERNAAAYADALRAQDYAVLAVRATLIGDRCARHGDCDDAAGWLDALVEDARAAAGSAPPRPLLIAVGRAAGAVPGLAASDAWDLHAAVTVDYCAAGSSAPTAPLRAPWYDFESPGAVAGCATTVRPGSALPGLHPTLLAAEPGATVPADFVAIVQWLDPRLAAQSAAAGGDGAGLGLPLIDLPVDGTRRAVVFLSGDGGWAELDRAVADALVAEGIAVIGWDALSYFWQAHPPAAMAADLGRVLAAYRERWHIEEFVLVGFSFGANVLPFTLAGLDGDAAQAAGVRHVVLLGPAASTRFEFHLRDWLGGADDGAVPVPPAIVALATRGVVPVTCLQGRDDDEAQCPSLVAPSRSLVLPGDHHFDGDYAQLAHLIAAGFSRSR